MAYQCCLLYHRASYGATLSRARHRHVTAVTTNAVLRSISTYITRRNMRLLANKRGRHRYLIVLPYAVGCHQHAVRRFAPLLNALRAPLQRLCSPCSTHTAPSPRRQRWRAALSSCIWRHVAAYASAGAVDARGTALLRILLLHYNISAAFMPRIIMALGGVVVRLAPAPHGKTSGAA